jgi:hypothetical protein
VHDEEGGGLDESDEVLRSSRASGRVRTLPCLLRVRELCEMLEYRSSKRLPRSGILTARLLLLLLLAVGLELADDEDPAVGAMAATTVKRTCSTPLRVGQKAKRLSEVREMDLVKSATVGAGR